MSARRARGRFWCAGLVSMLVLIATARGARAHDPGLSALTLELHQGRVAVHLVVARREVEPLVTIDADGDGAVTAHELAVARPRLQTLGTTLVVLDHAGGTPTIEDVAVDVDGSDALHLRLTLTAPARAQARVQVPVIARLALGHRQYVQVRDHRGRVVAEHVLRADALAFMISLDGTPAAGGTRDVRAFTLLGIEHIATGWDHLLFLLALLVVGPSLRTAAAIITSFTAAHSVTLALATLDIVRLTPAVVEPLIAASVLYVGLDNLHARPLAPRWMATFAFGLVHGLGFASALQDLGVPATAGAAAMPLLAFNAGVEIGQFAVAALVLPLVWQAQRRPRLFVWVAMASSIFVTVAGAAWLLGRTVFA